MVLQTTPVTLDRKPKVATVEFWRFVFTVIVSLYHLEIFFPKQVLFVSGTSAVEFFFVLSGFLIAMSARRELAGRTEAVTTREAHSRAVAFVAGKLRSIYPILIIALLLGVLVYPAIPAPFVSRLQALANTEWELLMLVGTPLGFAGGHTPLIPLWFLTALFVVGYIYTFAIYKNYDLTMFAAPVAGVLFFIYFTLNSSLSIDHEIKMGFLNAGMVRAVAEIGLGVSLFHLYERLSQIRLAAAWKIILSLLEVYAVYRLAALTFGQPVGPDNFRRLVYVLILVLLSFLNVTFLARALNRRIWRRLGAVSLAMYICHYNLIMLYFRLLGAAKIRLTILAVNAPLARTLRDFLADTGGADALYRPLAMTWKDMLLYTLLVVAVAVLITLFIAAFKKYVARPLAARLGQVGLRAEGPANGG